MDIMKRLGLSVLLALIALISLGSPRPAAAATFRVSETYRFELYNFAFLNNFWSGPNITDATTPVPIDRMSMSFRIDYLTPVSAALKYRGTARVDFAMLDFEMVLRDVPGLSEARTLTLADLTRSSSFVGRSSDGKNTLSFGGSVLGGDLRHRFNAYVPDMEIMALGSLRFGARFSVSFDSPKAFDSPRYIVYSGRRDLVDGVRQLTWQPTLLSQSATPSPVPLPAAGLLLAAALAGLGTAASRRARAPGRRGAPGAGPTGGSR